MADFTRMYVDHVPARVVVLLLLLVTLLFFCQVPQGSYQAMHGPTTTQKDILGGALLPLFMTLCIHLWCFRGQFRRVRLHAAQSDEPVALLGRDLPLFSSLRC